MLASWQYDSSTSFGIDEKSEFVCSAGNHKRCGCDTQRFEVLAGVVQKMSRGTENRMLKCVVSGSFRKHYPRITAVVVVLVRQGIQVLSPKASRIVNPGEDFAILETDLLDIKEPVIRHIEGKVLEHIRDCDLLYVCNPDGYLGPSTTMEIGFALALGKRIFVLTEPEESIVMEFVHEVIAPHDVSAHFGRLHPTRDGEYDA